MRCRGHIVLPYLMSTSIHDRILELGRRARAASRELAKLSTMQKNEILFVMARGIRNTQEAILTANAQDVARAEKNGSAKPMIDRLRLDPPGIEAMAHAIEEVAKLPDPVGEVLAQWSRPNGLRLEKIR